MKIVGAIIRRSGRRIQKYTDAISAAIDADDREAMWENIYRLLVYLGTGIAAWLIGFLLSALIHLNALYWKLTVVLGLFGIVAALDPDGDRSDDRGIIVEPLPPPTLQDYYAILETVQPALAAVADAIKLAPVHPETDICAVDGEEIRPLGNGWQYIYRAKKRTAEDTLDEALVKRVLQEQIRTVLENENPSGFAVIRFNRAEPILQVDKVKNKGAYIYIFIVEASEEYFRWKNQQKKRQEDNTGTADTSDGDF